MYFLLIPFSNGNILCVSCTDSPLYHGCIRDKEFILLTHRYSESDYCLSNNCSSPLFPCEGVYFSVLMTLNMALHCDLWTYEHVTCFGQWNVNVDNICKGFKCCTFGLCSCAPVNCHRVSMSLAPRKCGNAWNRAESNLSENRDVCCFKLLRLGVFVTHHYCINSWLIY